MKLALSLLLTIILFTFGCNKSDNSNPTGTTGVTSGFTSLSGTIDSWTGGSTDIAKFISEYDGTTVISQSPISGTGSFNLATLSDLSGSHIKALSSELHAGLSTDNPNVKTGSAWLYLYNSSGLNLYIILEGKIANENTTTVGDFYSSYIFADGAAKINGTYADTVSGKITKYTYSVQLAKGWNKVVQKVSKISGNNRELEIGNTFPETPKWILFRDN